MIDRLWPQTPLQWLGVLIIVLGFNNPAIAQFSTKNGFISPDVEQAIKERVCVMRKLGYTEGEIKEEARYMARVNQEPMAKSGTIAATYAQDITDILADSIVALTKCLN